jgi:hypothetical protein
MTRRSKVGLVVAVLFTLVNLAGVGFAAAAGELLHAGIHLVLLIPGAYFVWRFAPKRDGRRLWRLGGSETPDPTGELTDRLTNIEQSVDAVAIEVERIGEGQRFITRIFTEKGAARPIETKTGEGKEAGAP